MRALDLKLIRDLRRIWAQSLAIALVLGCGVMVLVLANGSERSLILTRDAYYDRNRFADVFATATRAPEALKGEIAHVEGVAQVDTRIAVNVVLDLPGVQKPAMARVLSLPPDGPPLLNVPLLRLGRMPDPLHPNEVVLSEDFAQANRLIPGETFRAILNGQMRTLTVTGLVLSPEFIYLIGPGTMMPDDQTYGIIWMNRDAVAAATDLSGAFNDIALQLTPTASRDRVIQQLDLLLAPYGGTGAYGRDRQTSDAFLSSELHQLSAMSLILPPIFLIVSAFLVNMVLSRLIALERPQIGLLKAIGYSGQEIATHYLKLSIGIGIIGVALGWIAGAWLGRSMTALYADFYRFPYLLYAPGTWSFVISGILGLVTVIVGALRAVRASARLSPAVAMLPPAAPLFRRGWIDGIGRTFRLRQTTMMILRSITRWPGRASVTLFGVSASVAVLIASFFSFDSMKQMVDEVFYQTNRQDITLTLTGSRLRSTEEAALTLPGVLRVEGAYSLPVRLIHGSKSRLATVEARGDGDVLARLLDTDGHPVRIPPEGLTLSESLAQELAVTPGDTIDMAMLVPPRETVQVPVAAVIRQSLGQSAYMAETPIFALMRQSAQVNQVHLLTDPAALPAFFAAVKRAPGVNSVTLWTDVRDQFDATMNENLMRMTIIYSILGILITVGVVYNAARIQLSERAHELASLRVLGFTRAEVGYVLVGELMLLTTVAIPFGWLGGYGFSTMIASGFSTDLFRIPLVITRKTYALASVITFASALASALIVRRRLDRVNIAMSLKQRQ